MGVVPNFAALSYLPSGGGCGRGSGDPCLRFNRRRCVGTPR